MIQILLMMIFMNSMLFYKSKTPLSMGLILLIQTLMIMMICGMLSINFWYSYILLLIMLGGMLILFIYVSSLSSNQKFNFNKKSFTIKIMMMMIMIMLIYNLNIYNLNNMDLSNLILMNLENNYNLKMSLNKLYNLPTNLIMILMINYLLLTLFIVVKNTNIKMGPLRKKN